MFDAPVDVWFLWIGLAIVSTAVMGVATQFPTQPLPDATGVVSAVDSIAASPYPATGTHPIAAGKVKLGPSRIALKNDRGTAHSTFAYGPITPVHHGTPLWEILRGAAPSHLFESPERFGRAAAAARNRTPTWRSAGGELTARRVTWGEINVTLVSA